MESAGMYHTLQSGEVVHASDRQDAIDRCPVLADLAQKSPEKLETAFFLAEMGAAFMDLEINADAAKPEPKSTQPGQKGLTEFSLLPEPAQTADAHNAVQAPVLAEMRLPEASVAAIIHEQTTDIEPVFVIEEPVNEAKVPPEHAHIKRQDTRQLVQEVQQIVAENPLTIEVHAAGATQVMEKPEVGIPRQQRVFELLPPVDVARHVEIADPKKVMPAVVLPGKAAKTPTIHPTEVIKKSAHHEPPAEAVGIAVVTVSTGNQVQEQITAVRPVEEIPTSLYPGDELNVAGADAEPLMVAEVTPDNPEPFVIAEASPVEVENLVIPQEAVTDPAAYEVTAELTVMLETLAMPATEVVSESEVQELYVMLNAAAENVPAVSEDELEIPSVVPIALNAELESIVRMAGEQSEPGSFEGLLEATDDRAPAPSIAEIQEHAAARPLEETFVQLAGLLADPGIQETHREVDPNTGVTETDTIQEAHILLIPQILVKLEKSLAAVPQERGDTAVAPQVSHELAGDLLVLLKALGYENPQQAIRKMVEEHGILYLLDALERLCVLSREANRQEFTARRPLLAAADDDDEPGRSHIVRRLTSLSLYLTGFAERQLAVQG